MLTRDAARALIGRIVELSKADEIQVSLNDSEESNIRVADNRITTSGKNVDLSIRIYSAFGKKHAITTTNDLTDEGLERAVRLSETLARLAPENPEALPLLGPQTYKEVAGHFASTANASAAERAKAAQLLIDGARKAGDIQAAGFLQAHSSANAVGNNKGLFAYAPGTGVDYTLTVRTADGTGSGWAGANHPDWTKIDFAAVSETAISKARLSRNAKPIEPGRYTVILEPAAAGDLVSLLANALDARPADEGRSAFAKQGGGTKLGEKIVDERVTLLSDPSDPELFGSPFDNDGMPLSRQVWIESGVLKSLGYSRFWAQKQGKTATGNANTLKMVGGDQSLEQIIATTERGVLVTRFWYIRPVNARTLLYTGLTRDGTFLIENGKISRPVRNMRFNESPLFMLDKLEAIGKPVRLAGDFGGGGTAMPALRVRDFHFTSLSDAV